MEIFFDLNVALTKQRNSLGVGKGGLPSLGTGLLCPLTEDQLVSESDSDFENEIQVNPKKSKLTN